MKAIIYCRKSTDRSDRQQLSISAQEQEARRIAEREGLEIVEIFKETKSAKEPGRPLFNEMMKLFSKGKADCIVTWKLNRLARNPIDEGSIKWSIQSGLIKAIYTEGETFKTGDNVLIMGMHFGMSTQYILDLQRDIKRGMKKKIEEGGVCQKAPLGYINNKSDKSIEIDLIKSKWVKEIFNLRVSKMAYSNISKFLFSKGIKKDNGKAFSVTTLESIIKNKFYIGIVKFNGTFYKGNYKTFISEKLFNEANEIYQGLYEQKNSGIKYPLKGIIKDEKGLFLNVYTKKGHIYYKSQTKSPINVNINEKTLLEKIGELLNNIEIKGEFKEFNKKIALKVLEKGNREEEIKLTQLKKELEKLEDKKQNLLDLRLEGEIDRNIYNQKFNDIILKINNIENQKKDILDRKDIEKINAGVELACSLYKSYNQGDLEQKSDYLRKNRVELLLNTKKELSLANNSFFKFINFLNLQYGGA